MAFGIEFDNGELGPLGECVECNVDGACYNKSCEMRMWIAPCNSINYRTGELDENKPFMEPRTYKLENFDVGYELLEKNWQGCKTSRLPGIPDPSFTVTFDICQGDPASILLLGKCAFDYVISPIANNINFDPANGGNASIWDQRTKIWWGRVIGDNYTWEFPQKECQSATRTYLTDRYCYETDIEAAIPTAQALEEAA